MNMHRSALYDGSGRQSGQDVDSGYTGGDEMEMEMAIDG